MAVYLALEPAGGAQESWRGMCGEGGPLFYRPYQPSPYPAKASLVAMAILEGIQKSSTFWQNVWGIQPPGPVP